MGAFPEEVKALRLTEPLQITRDATFGRASVVDFTYRIVALYLHRETVLYVFWSIAALCLDHEVATLRR